MEYQGCPSFERKTDSVRAKAMGAIGKSEEARQLLLELESMLKERREENWIRGIKAAIGELTTERGMLNESGFESARSIYRTMNEGGRGFAEYSVWLDSEDDRISVNRKMDDLRTRLWQILGL